ncbi:MAG: hypothetical protein QHH74_01415 [Spirochaetota bacterium]|nr:hypothetical protein [Spirochaetota bacterium]
MKKCFYYIVIFWAIVAVNGCTGNKPLFDELSGSRLKVVIKGTFESTSDSASIRSWDWDNTVSHPQSIPQSIDDSVNDFITDSSEQFPTTFMVDIAEMKLDDDEVSNYRQVFTARVDDADPFFNGQGVQLKCDDVKPGKLYTHVKLYIRKLIFDNATQWHIDLSNNVIQDSDPEVIFHEEKVSGFDFNQLMVNTYYDYLKENYQEINRVFPLVIPIDGGLVVNEDEEVVLEIRLVIKNFIKLYEYDFTNDNGYGAAYHYWAPSDWLRDVQPDDVYIGGNLLGVARVYRKDKVATVSGTTAQAGYVIAIPATDVYGNPQTIAVYFLDTSLPIWTRPRVYPPAKPSVKVGTVEGLLDYYLRYEQYKIEYNHFVEAVNNGSYETDWNDYNDYKWSLRLPPLVAYSHGDSHGDGYYTMTNVPYGYYLFYFVADGSYGELPDVDNVQNQKSVSISEPIVNVDFQ